MNGNATADINVPIKINGILLPILVFVLSDSVPKIGSKINAARLSRAIMIPTKYWTLNTSSAFRMSLTESQWASPYIAFRSASACALTEPAPPRITAFLYGQYVYRLIA